MNMAIDFDEPVDVDIDLYALKVEGQPVGALLFYKDSDGTVVDKSEDRGVMMFFSRLYEKDRLKWGNACNQLSRLLGDSPGEARSRHKHLKGWKEDA